MKTSMLSCCGVSIKEHVYKKKLKKNKTSNWYINWYIHTYFGFSFWLSTECKHMRMVSYLTVSKYKTHISLKAVYCLLP